MRAYARVVQATSMDADFRAFWRQADGLHQGKYKKCIPCKEWMMQVLDGARPRTCVYAGHITHRNRCACQVGFHEQPRLWGPCKMCVVRRYCMHPVTTDDMERFCTCTGKCQRRHEDGVCTKLHIDGQVKSLVTLMSPRRSQLMSVLFSAPCP